MKRRTHRAGDFLVEQGGVAQALFILSAGVLVAIQSHGTGEEEAMRLAPGDSFGEAGLLTGAATMFTIRALTKVTVYEIADIRAEAGNRRRARRDPRAAGGGRKSAAGRICRSGQAR